MDLLEGYLSEDETAEEIGKKTRALRRWHLKRIGPSRTLIGRSVYYKRESLLAWLASREQKQPRAHHAA
jgi:hypothetical protein